jgi:hypothetical protein
MGEWRAVVLEVGAMALSSIETLGDVKPLSL